MKKSHIWWLLTNSRVNYIGVLQTICIVDHLPMKIIQRIDRGYICKKAVIYDTNDDVHVIDDKIKTGKDYVYLISSQSKCLKLIKWSNLP